MSGSLSSFEIEMVICRKAFKEAEAAYLKYYKAEKNMDISRLDLERAKNTANVSETVRVDGLQRSRKT